MADSLNALEKQFLTCCEKRGEMVAPKELASPSLPFYPIA